MEKSKRWILYQKTLKHWGKEAQLMMLFEEIGELQQAISKKSRGQGSILHIAEEVADVEIMLEQIKVLYCIDAKVEECRKDKLQRLKLMLNK